MKKFSWSIWGLLAIFCAVMYYFIYLAPYMTDNFVFSHNLAPNYATFYSGGDVRVEPLTLSSAFSQAREMYSTWCGRYMGNLAVYLLFLLPHWLYALVAALLFGLYILLLQMLVFGRNWRAYLSPMWFLIIGALVWTGIPSFGEAFFWLSVGGQIALLGQALAFLPLRFSLDAPLRARNRALGFLGCLALLAGGIAVCSLDYPTSAALPVTALACVGWLYFHEKKGQRKIPWLELSLALGLCIGAWLTLKAPGNYCRLQLSTDPGVIQYMQNGWGWRILSWLSHLPGSIITQFVPFILLGISLWTMIKKWGKEFWKKIPLAAWLFLLPTALTYGAYLFTSWPPSRAFATTSMQITLAGLIIFIPARKFIPFNHIRLMRGALFLFCLSTVVFEIHNFWLLHNDMQKRAEAIEQARGGEAVLPRLTAKSDNYQVLGSNLGDLSPDPHFWINRAMALHHGLKSARLIEKFPSKQSIEAIPEERRPFQADKEGSGYGLSTQIGQTRIYVSAAGNSENILPEEIHYYYSGSPGLLNAISNAISDELEKKVFDWLKNARAGDWRLRLVPILFARTDIKLKKGADGSLLGESRPLNLTSRERIWLVRPGAGKYSFDLQPLYGMEPKAPENAS